MPLKSGLLIFLILGGLCGCAKITSGNYEGPGHLPGTWEHFRYASIGGDNQDQSQTFVFEPSGVLRYEATYAGDPLPGFTGKWRLEGNALKTTRDSCIVTGNAGATTVEHDCPLYGSVAPVWDADKERVYTLTDEGQRRYFFYKKD